MSRGIVLKMPLSAFLLEANRVAGEVRRNADRLRVASGGRITAETADEMQQLVEEILRMGREREVKPVGPIRPLVARAERLVTEIGAAAKVVALQESIVAEQLRRVRSGGRQRSAFGAAWALEMHLGLVREHRAAFAAVLGDGFLHGAEALLRSIEEHRTMQSARVEASAARTRARDGVVLRLQAVVGEARRVLTVSASTAGDARIESSA